ncbi:HNH endonuclease [Paenibacillus polymyxa]|uniref:HNH endonuclease n=1 Tax=Paenibacillus polymyxa TaxID=1406 RepID=UPI0019F6D3E9|nr:HNH endonuclease [Paenibacillus polymyxa]
MAQVKKDNQKECDYCGKLFHIKPSAVDNRKTTCCSVECAGLLRSVVYVGADHPRWNPDLTDEERLQARSYPEYTHWRKDVFFRDGYACVSCGDSRGGNLVAHHVRNYAEYVEGRTDVDNGVTLCETCHVAFHNQYGYTGNTERQLIEFIHEECA